MDENSFISSFRGFTSRPSGLLWALAILAALETGARAAWRPAVVGERLYSSLDRSYNYGYADDVPHVFHEGAEDVYSPTEYVNIRPFRVLRQKPSNELRIVTVGGSVSRGSGLRDGSDYSAVLEGMLRDDHPGLNWRVLNLSADGIGSSRMYQILRNTARLNPDVVIAHVHGTNEYEDERDARERDEIARGVNGLLLKSQFLVLLKKAATRTRSAPGPSAVAAEEARASADPDRVRRWFSTMESNISRIECLAEQLNAPVIYVGRAERDAPGYRSEGVERLNRPIASKPYFVDTAAALHLARQEHAGEGKVFFMDNTHFSESGHRAVAKRLYELLRPGAPLWGALTARVAHRPVPTATDVPKCD